MSAIDDVHWTEASPAGGGALNPRTKRTHFKSG
jgi:hypothetical protein